MLDLKDDEKRLAREIEIFLGSSYPIERSLVRRRFECLDNLGKVITEYPSVRETTMLRGTFRDEGQLLNALCSFASASHLLHIPCRVVLTRSFWVAKFQAFAMLSILVKGREEFTNPLAGIMHSIIHTLMIEEVYFSCLEDPGFSQEIKIRIADDLITLWDSGTDPRQVRHLPAFQALWTARNENPPAFGTMNGSSELLRITIDLEDDWQEFLVSQTSVNESRWALEEFLFGLSYEEIQTVRSRLASQGIAAVGHDEVSSYLDHPPAYGVVSGSDYRAIYNFYINRREAALFRKRVGVPGPRTTLEEIYLKYRIARE